MHERLSLKENFCTYLSQLLGYDCDVFLVTCLHFWVIVSIILKRSKQEKIFNFSYQIKWNKHFLRAFLSYHLKFDPLLCIRHWPSPLNTFPLSSQQFQILLFLFLYCKKWCLPKLTNWVGTAWIFHSDLSFH